MLSRRVCGWMEWRSASGRPQEMSCRKALAQLARAGHLQLPEAQAFAPPRATPETPVTRAALAPVETPALDCGLEALGGVRVTPVGSRYSKASKTWRALLDQHHYLGSGPLCGAQTRYLVTDGQGRALGALAFSAGVFALEARDTHIGWTEDARRHNLARVVCNSRFLIAPSVRVKNLASHVLGLALERLAQDWEARYHVRPVLVETFVDETLFRGTCYAASNWTRVGTSAGRRDGVPKAVYVRPLCGTWRGVLCTEPPRCLGQTPGHPSPSNWAHEEFGRVRLHDERLKERLYTIAQDFEGSPQSTIPEACGSLARTVAAYRFFANKKLSMDVILTAHTEATIKRIKAHKVVLAPQDTTYLDYSTHPMTEGLGPTGTSKDSSLGLILHDTLAFTPEGTPLGVLDAQCWARDPQNRPQKKERHELPIEEKESAKWLRSFRKVAQVQSLCPDTTLVSIGDRESDVYELFEQALGTPEGPKLLVRMNYAARRKTEEGPLREVMTGKPPAATMNLHIPHAGTRKARDTSIEVRFDQVTLLAPQRRKKDGAPIHLWAVHALEPAGHALDNQPVEWMLLTTVPVNSLADAQERLEWYTCRWGIEVYHRTLKSGCRIKERQLETADRLETCLGIDMVVAWRVYHLAMLGRETPSVPCTAFFQDEEWKALCCYVTRNPVPPEAPPTLDEAMCMVARIGGHLGRKSDGAPGTQTLWRGLQRLHTATEVYVLFNTGTPAHFQAPP